MEAMHSLARHWCNKPVQTHVMHGATSHARLAVRRLTRRRQRNRAQSELRDVDIENEVGENC
jgi:hypothetical protein